MPFKFKYLLLILGLQVFNSCSEKTKGIQKTDNYKIISINLNEEMTKVSLSSLLNEDISFIPLETNEESVIGRIDKVRITDEYVFILDINSAQSIFKFSKDGKFLQKIGVKGEGPKELLRPLDFNLSDNKIKVLDNGVSIITYDFEGNFIDRIPLKNTTALTFQVEKSSGDYIFISGDNDYHLKIFNSRFENKASFFKSKSPFEEQVIINSLFTSHKEEIIFRRFLNDTIFKISNGSLIPHKLLNFKSNKLTKDDLIYTNEQELLSKIKNKSVIRNYFESDNARFLVFDLKSDIWVAINYKDTNKTSVFKFKNLINDVTYEANTTYVIGNHANEFIFLVEPWSILQNNHLNKDANHSEWNKIISQLKPSDNPILMLASFKQNDL